MTELRETERDVQRKVEEGDLAGRYCVWVGNGNSNGNVYWSKYEESGGKHWWGDESESDLRVSPLLLEDPR